jgi:hypothetical protein
MWNNCYYKNLSEQVMRKNLLFLLLFTFCIISCNTNNQKNLNEKSSIKSVELKKVDVKKKVDNEMINFLSFWEFNNVESLKIIADKTGQQLAIIRLGALLALLSFTALFWMNDYWIDIYYFHSLNLLSKVKEIDPEIFTKSGIMVGLGEEEIEVMQVMDDMRSADIDFMTIGQYLQPTKKHTDVIEFIRPEQFVKFKKRAKAKGFLHVSSSPLTRSSHHASEDFEVLQTARKELLQKKGALSHNDAPIDIEEMKKHNPLYE